MKKKYFYNVFYYWSGGKGSTIQVLDRKIDTPEKLLAVAGRIKAQNNFEQDICIANYQLIEVKVDKMRPVVLNIILAAINILVGVFCLSNGNNIGAFNFTVAGWCRGLAFMWLMR